LRVLITGSGGNLGRVLVPGLVDAGHVVRTLDFRGGDVTGDVRDPNVVRRALEGVDAVVHAAALHGIHLDRRSPHAFWATNVDGTFTVYEGCREAGVRHVVLCSTMGVYGPDFSQPQVMDDASPVRPRDVYGLSKAVAEDIARGYWEIGGVSTVALRLGMFVPESWERYGFRLLFGGVDTRDVADAVIGALAYVPPDGFEAMNVMADVLFDDPWEFAADPHAVLERHWPELRTLEFLRVPETRQER
jgi:nucleoside-diphosphate-sugar epimerase